MVLRGSSGSGGKLKFKFSRPMLIVIGALVVLLILSVVLGLTVFKRPAAQGGKAVAEATQAPRQTEVPKGAATIAVQATQPPAATAAPPTAPPQVTAVPTFAPAPTQIGAVTGATPTQGIGGGELPGTAGPVSWGFLLLIPAGAILLAAAVWWRWRRVHSG